MEGRSEREAALFVRYEARIVTLELRVEALQNEMKKYTPIVDVLHEAALAATAFTVKVEQARRGALSRWQIVVGVFALFIPPLVSSGLTLLVLRG